MRRKFLGRAALSPVSCVLFLIASGCCSRPAPAYYRAQVVDRVTREPIPNAEADVKRSDPSGKAAKKETGKLDQQGRLFLSAREYSWRLAPDGKIELVFRAPGYVPGRAVLTAKDFDGALRRYGLRPRPPGEKGEVKVEDLPAPEVVPPAAFCRYAGGMWSPAMAMVGMRPLVHIDRTLLPEDLERDGPGGFHVGLMRLGLFTGSLSLNYLPLEGEDSGRDVDAYWFDMGIGGACPLTGEEWALVPAVRFEMGYSLLFMDFERSTYDTAGLGLFSRMGLGVWGRDARFGLEVFGDVHGWVGGDSHQVQAAWAATLGVQLLARF